MSCCRCLSFCLFDVSLSFYLLDVSSASVWRKTIFKNNFHNFINSSFLSTFIFAFDAFESSQLFVTIDNIKHKYDFFKIDIIHYSFKHQYSVHQFFKVVDVFVSIVFLYFIHFIYSAHFSSRIVLFLSNWDLAVIILTSLTITFDLLIWAFQIRNYLKAVKLLYSIFEAETVINVIMHDQFRSAIFKSVITRTINWV